MKVVISSLNLQGFDYWDTRAAAILQYYHDRRPDIICFQEVVYLPQVAPHTPVHLLNETLGYPHKASDVTRLQKGIEYPIYREGLATLSTFTILHTETIVLEQADGDEHTRIIQLVDFRTKSGLVIKLANVHFSITDFVDYATAHLEETLTILNSRNERRIIIGDFNLAHLEDSKALWEADYTSTCDTPYVTYPLMNKRVDYALVPKEYSIDEIDISPDGLSDHRAITVTITIPETT